MTRKRRPANAQSDRRERRIDSIPTWLQAIAALAGVLLSALVIFGIVRQPTGTPGGGQPTQPAATAPGAAATSVAQGRVTLVSVVTAPTEVRADGTFQNLAAGREVVVLIGQPIEDETAEWLPAIAALHPDAQEASLQSGRWEAVRPAAGGRYRWYAVIAPYAPGAQDPFADLRAEGPDADLVVAASEPLTTD